MRLLILIAVIGMIGIFLQESHADSDFTLDATGFGKINGKVDYTSLHMSLLVSDSKMPVFVDGQISLGYVSDSIDKASITFSNDKRTVLLNAETKNYFVSASGKIILTVGENLVYRLSGKTSDGNIFSALARLEPSLTTINVPESKQVEKSEILLLVRHTDRVEWKSPYKFTARTLDPKTNPMPEFAVSSGYLEGITVSATITNPLGDVIKTSNGKTQRFGYYEDSVIIPDNARTGVYKMTLTASGQGYENITREFTFVVIPLNTRPT
jgi:hypothetical protein